MVLVQIVRALARIAMVLAQIVRVLARSSATALARSNPITHQVLELSQFEVALFYY